MLKLRTKNERAIKCRATCVNSPFFATVVVLFCLLGGSHARAQTSTFDTNDEGWVILSLASLSSNDYRTIGFFTTGYSPNGGNPGGFIYSNSHPGDFVFASPGTFIGDRSSAIGTTFSYDIMHSGAVDYQTTDVFFFGRNGQKLLWEASSPLIPSSTWMTVSFSLAPSPEWHLNTTTGLMPTLADFQGVFGQLDSIVIRGRYSQFGGETTAIDNVMLVPEPSTVCLVGLGSILLIALRCYGTKNASMRI